MALHEIIYVSLATHDMRPDELVKLLDHARQHNARRGITGLLLYHRREFLQLIEGERSAVEALYSAICLDPRHQQVHTLWDGPIETLGFGQWSMGFVAPDETVLRQHPGYEDLLGNNLHQLRRGSSGKKILQQMRDEILSAA
ncbi:MAG: BLUF domain-containing protein [Hydrogenophaga sp.]|jgi:hypothetical protein|nr:BLUF domain-containing protein [Hydrogenophaga sp.]